MTPTRILRLWTFLAALAPAAHASPASSRTFYVSASRGSDDHSGLSKRKAWKSLAKVNLADLKPGDCVLFRRGESWRGQLRPKSGEEGRPILYGAYGRGAKPLFLGSSAFDRPEQWSHAGGQIWVTRTPAQGNEDSSSLSVDVGNIIFDQGQSCGVKKWRVEDLKTEGDFVYLKEGKQVKLCSPDHPAKLHRSIEMALCRHMVDQSNVHHVIYEDLGLRYGAAHGFGGAFTHHITIRNCELGFIGGGHQFTRDDGVPVRYGNGIEFWAGAHDNRVEGCRIWEVYDAALTNQSMGDSVVQKDIAYVNNVIYRCEYSFEYWNRPESSLTENILFEHNTCVDAGGGWGHGQRPDPNGRHLMFYQSPAQARNIVIQNNIFCNSTDSGLRMESDWTSGLTMDRNLWFEEEGPLFLFLRETFQPDQIEAFRAKSHLDLNSEVARPQFEDPAKDDYRLRPNTPGTSWTEDGAPCGALSPSPP